MAKSQFFVRWRGKITGPFDLELLKRMVAQGRLSKLHGVSADQTDWGRAGAFEELFPPHEVEAERLTEMITGLSPEPAIASPIEGQLEQAGEEPSEWYYAQGQQVEGPCSASVIRRLVAEGALTLDDSVNASSDPWVWQPIRDVPEFASVARAQASAEPGHAEAGAPAKPLAEEARTVGDYSGLAVASFVLGLVGVLVPICGLVGLICASKAKHGMTASGNHAGMGMATAGTVLGIVDVGFDVVKLGILLAVLVKPLIG
jgi:hypothetical protein